jgi:hypothetical protein
MALQDLSDEEILRVAGPIMDNLMDASTHLDYGRHVRDFSERVRAMLDEPRFRAVCEQYQRDRGQFGRRELMGILRRPHSIIVTWKQWFTKAEGEYLAELVLAEQDGRTVVERVMIL